LRRKLAWKAKLSPISLPADFKNTSSIKLQSSLFANHSFLGKNNFQFLNISHDFLNDIDWNFAEYGKLWTYNLNYFEFLSQPHMNKETGLDLIQKYIASVDKLKDGLEPFPISLRTIFWIKFLVKYEISNLKIDTFLYRQIQLLQKQLEYHLLGNHLLENAFALLFSAYYFSDNQLFKRAKKILKDELQEQILPDGAHFELSPMYHQLILYRLLDSINLLKNNPEKFLNNDLDFLTEKAEEMLSYLEYITFSDGSIPHFNDSTNGIAPSSKELFDYAKSLNISPKRFKPNICSQNYQKYKSSQFEIFVDIGDIGADYIPGHAHSDNLHFVLQHQGKALFVDTGISTYEKNQKRYRERSTSAHNTVQIADNEQSDVWGGFRVGRRAKSTINQMLPTKTKATQDGYNFMGIHHERTFKWQEKTIGIIDKLSSIGDAKARFHFHPNIKIDREENTLSGDFGFINFKGATKVDLEEYQFAHEFNKTQKARVAVVYFDKHLHTIIELK